MRPHLAAAMDLFIARLAGVKIAAIGRTGPGGVADVGRAGNIGQAGVAEVAIELSLSN